MSRVCLAMLAAGLALAACSHKNAALSADEQETLAAQQATERATRDDLRAADAAAHNAHPAASTTP